MPAEAPTQPRASEGPATGAPTPESVEAIATRLVGWTSVTGTPGEAAFAGRLADLLAGRDWARAEGSVLRLIDPTGTSSRHRGCRESWLPGWSRPLKCATHRARFHRARWSCATVKGGRSRP